MRVTIQETKDGEAFFEIPDEYLEQLQWEEGDIIEWIDNKDGTWTLNNCSIKKQRHG